MKRVDAPWWGLGQSPQAPLPRIANKMKSTCVVALTFISFASLHSLTVSRAFKRAVASAAGETWMRAYYRLVFTVFSAAITALAAYVIFSQPDVMYYRPDWYIALPARMLQIAGVVMLFVAMRPFDIGYFTGVRQSREFAGSGSTGGDMEGIKGNTLVTTGLYGLVRHPMYLAGILIFLFEPDVTQNNLVLRGLAVLYFVLGALIEERRFLADFGESYREYQKKVPMFNIWAGILRRARR
jgi:protein-S-isoprenylcysteine O-methyltransferase Ste14